MNRLAELVAAVRRANHPGPAEDSVFLRVATTGCVATSIAACWAEGELTATITLGAIAAVIVGNVFSFRRRDCPVAWLKLLLAAAAIGAFGWFFVSVSASVNGQDVAAVEGPLAALFAWIQVTHSFDVPSRRDLGFSLAGSVTLVAVAGAQATDIRFGLYVLVWAGFGLAALMGMWWSMSGVRPRPWHVGGSGLAVLVVAGLLIALLPAPRATSTVVFPASVGNGIELATPEALVGGGPSGNGPARAATADGSTRVGGYLGFAGPLDTAIRGALGSETVLRVRAERPSFWIAETFNRWNGRSWTEAPLRSPQWRVLDSGSPFVLSPSGGTAGGTTDIQTFYLLAPGANVILHAAGATEVWFPARRLFIDGSGNIRASTSMGAGSVYTVASTVSTPTAAQLQDDPPTGAGPQLSATERAVDTRLPRPYTRAHALARRITAGKRSRYADILALEAWIGAHTRYTTHIPPLAPGQDTVNEFLFGNRRGYCEQISTALAVMLRSLDIPSREATGYVPGPFNPITDLYDIEAKDAHAWVQVWFPRYGWVSFDPTAQVPLANPSPASAMTHDLLAAARHVPWVPVGMVVALGSLVAVLVRRRRRRPNEWTGAVTMELERAARRAGNPPQPAETLLDLGARVDRFVAGSGIEGTATLLARTAEDAAFGSREPPTVAERREVVHTARRVRRAAARRRRVNFLRGASGARSGGNGAGRNGAGGSRAGQPRATASASSHDAPAASSGR